MFDKMKKTVFPAVMVALIFALTLGTVVFAAGDFSIGGNSSSYGLILEKKIGNGNQEELAQNKNYSFWVSGESIERGSRTKWVNGIVTITGPSRETVYIAGCDSRVIVAEIRNDLTVKQVKNATTMVESQSKTVALYDDILEIIGPKLIKNGDTWTEDTTSMRIKISKVPVVQEVAELHGKYMVITGKAVDENDSIISDDVKEIAVWTADIDDTELSIDRNGVIPADKNRFYLTPTGDSVTFISDEIGKGDEREYVFHIDGKGEHGTPVNRTVTLKAGESISLKKLPHDSYLVTEEPGFSIGEGQGILEPRPVEVHIGPFSELTITKHKTFDSLSENGLKLVLRTADEDATFVAEAVFQPVETDTPEGPDGEDDISGIAEEKFTGAENGLDGTEENPAVVAETLDKPVALAETTPQEVTVTGLTAGALYRVVDYEHGGFTVSFVNQLPVEVTARSDSNGMPETIFTNTYDKKIGSLLVSKTVNGTKEGLPEEFTFTLTMQSPDGTDFNGEYLCTIGSSADGAATTADGMIKFENGRGTVTLKHGQFIRIDGLLVGTRYTVSETMAKIDGEDAFATVKINGKKVTPVDDMVSTGETLIVEGENEVAFLNQTSGGDGPVGSNDDVTDLVIRKTVVNPDDDDINIDDDDFIIIEDFFFDDDDIIIEDDDFFGDDDIIIEDEEEVFTFVLTVKDAGGRPLKDHQLYIGGSFIDGVEPAESGYLFCGSGTFTLKHGQFVTVKGVPVGGTYEVEEIVTENYPTAEINGEWVEESEGMFSSGVIKIARDDNVVDFTNYMVVEIEDPDVPLVGLPEDELTITKTVKDAKEGDAQEFEFTLTLKDAQGRDLVGFYEFTGGSIADGVEPAADDFAFIVGSYSFILKNGQSLTMKEVPISTVYEVTEKAVADFPVVKVNGTVVAVADGIVSSGEGEVAKGGNVVAFTNQKDASDDDDPKDDDVKGDDPEKDDTPNGGGDSENDHGEKSEQGDNSHLDKQDGEVDGKGKKDTDTPKTGDSSQIAAWAMVCGASFAAILLLLWWRRKHLNKPSL